MFKLAVKSDFAASHSLPSYPGKCQKLHGHTWKVEVAFEGETLNEGGMVVDFAILKEKLNTFLQQLDHAHLNDLPAFENIDPTTEHLAQFIFREFKKACLPLKLKEVTVWESENASITYCE